MGRVMNGVGPVREELAYRLVRAAGIQTYLTRVMQVTYEDTGAQTKLETFGMIVESGDDAAQRLAKLTPSPIDPAGVYLDTKKGEATGTITADNQSEITVAEGLVGNSDFSVSSNHNIDPFGIVKAPAIFKIAADFDLSSMTLGDIPGYWGSPITSAQPGLANAAVAAKIRERRAAMEEAYASAEKDAIDAKAVTTDDGKTTTDAGFAVFSKAAHRLLVHARAQRRLTSFPRQFLAHPHCRC